MREVTLGRMRKYAERLAAAQPFAAECWPWLFDIKAGTPNRRSQARFLRWQYNDAYTGRSFAKQHKRNKRK